MLLGNNLSGSHERETEIPCEILVSVISLDLRVLDNGCLDDLDVTSHSSVSSCHIVIHLTDRAGESKVSVLLVHIVSSASASVAKPNSEVLNLSRRFIEDLGDIKDLTTSALGLGKRFHIIPKLGFSNNLVTSEYLHSKDLRARVLRCGCSATDKLIQVHLRECLNSVIRNNTYLHAEGSNRTISLDHCQYRSKSKKFFELFMLFLMVNSRAF